MGTSKVSGLVWDSDPSGLTVKVLATGHAPCSGLNKGMVVDIDATTTAIRHLLSNLESECPTLGKINQVNLSISGHHVNAMPSNGIVGVHGHEITDYDVERVLEAARAVSLSANQEILDILPTEYIVDGQTGVDRPVGMAGVRLEVRVLLVVCSTSAVQNMLKCVKKAGVNDAKLMLSHLGSSHAVLSKDEKQLGVCVLDIGSGTTDVTVYARGAIRHLAVIPIAGDHVTNDISMALCTPHVNAEKIKLNHGVLTDNEALLHDVVEVVGVADASQTRQVKRQVIAEVIQARYYELFRFVGQVLEKESLLSEMPAGIVLTGGGSRLPGLKFLAERMFKLPARVAWPEGEWLPESLKHESNATMVGLCRLMSEQTPAQRSNKVSSVWKKISRWAEVYF